MVHGLKGDQRQLLVNGELGDGPVLDAVRPAPQNLPVLQLCKIFSLRLGQEHDVGLRYDLLSGGHRAHQGGQHVVGHAKTGPISGFNHHPGADFGFNPGKVLGVDGGPALIGLAGCPQDAEPQRRCCPAHFRG